MQLKQRSSVGVRHRGTRNEQSIQRIMDDVRRIFRRVDALSRRAERVTGLTGPQLWTLKVLRETGSTDVSTLARSMGLHGSTLARMLDRLVSKGLVEWQRPRRTGGSPRVTVSGEGEYVGARAPLVAQELLLDGLRRLSPGGRTSVSTGVNRLVRTLGAEKTPAQLLFSEEVNHRPARRAHGGRRDAPAPS